MHPSSFWKPVSEQGIKPSVSYQKQTGGGVRLWELNDH